MSRRELRRGRLRDDAGGAIVEFVGLAVILLIPLVYLVVAVFEVQRHVFAVTQAAREAGRAVVTADDLDSGLARAAYAAELALDSQGVDGPVEIAYRPTGSGCAGPAGGAETLQPGADFVVCVRKSVTMPGIPSILAGEGVTVTGRYAVQVDDFRTAGSP